MAKKKAEKQAAQPTPVTVIHPYQNVVNVPSASSSQIIMPGINVNPNKTPVVMVSWPDAHGSNAPTYNTETGVLTINDRTISLEGSERDVLGTLVLLRAGTFSDLQATQSPRPDKILNKLCKKYPELQSHILFPGAKGHGGYSTDIASANLATIGP